MLDDVTVLAWGEFGRTPKINAKGGRDHWGGITPLMVAGGGAKVGQVIGQSNADASRPVTTPFNNSNLVATILHQLLDVVELRTVTGLPNDVSQILSRYTPIHGLT